jgi:hypothetical protein
MRLWACLVVVVGLCATAASGALVTNVIDFGTDTGQTNSGTTGFSIWGGWGDARTRDFTADALNIHYSPTGTWKSSGEQYRGSTFFSAVDLDDVDPSGKLTMEARVILGNPSPDYYKYVVTLVAASGHTSAYAFINSVKSNPTPFSYGTDEGTVPFTVVEATTDMGHPISVGGGGFVFGTDVLAGMDIQYQSGNSPNNVGATFTMQIDNIQAPLPEPMSLGIVAMGTALLLVRRRA